MMKIAITGASGQIGKLLIPLLKREGHELLLIGRHQKRLEILYTAISTSNYDEFPVKAANFDLILHLAVLNNNISAPIDEFYRVNVELTLKIAETADRIGINKFIFVSSIHALENENVTPYAVTKREAVNILRQKYSNNLEILYLPSVHGVSYSGKLAVLNSFPVLISGAIFSFLSALKPTLHISKLAAHITRNDFQTESEAIISDRQFNNLIFQFVKRSIDLSFAAFIILFFWWVLLLTWIAIRLDSPGKAIFAQKRVGQHGKVFTCYKFRSMQQDTIQIGTHDVPASAITKIGSFLRRTKIDELPQVLNILRNEMSLVGPRPCLPVQLELLKQRQMRGVLDVKPGITGLAQTNGIDMSEPARLAAEDQKYIALQSVILDAKIILRTVFGKGAGDRVKVD